MRKGMGIVKFVVYLLLSIVTLFVVCLAQVGVYSALTAQTKDNDARIYFVTDTKTENVSYVDSARFWGTEIKTNFKFEPKYRVRNWLPWEWWKKSMYYVDYPVDVVVGFVKPIIAPMAQVNEMNKYYHTDPSVYSNSYFVWAEELKYDDYYADLVADLDAKKSDGFTELALNDLLINVQNGDKTFGQWVDEYDLIYTELFKLIKYNQVDEKTGNKIYSTVYNKFVNEDGKIKTSVYVMYFQIYVSIFLTIYILTQIPLMFDVGENGEAKVKGSIFTRRRKSRKQRRKEKLALKNR